MPEQRTIRRTLCIGIGGTGRDTLMRLRRLIIDRYGKLSEFPIVQFLHIDADKAAGENAGLRTGKTYNGEEIIFNQAEKVVATMNSREVDDLANGLKERDRYETQSPYEHIKSWFPPLLRNNLKAIEDGASGVRPIGRVAYFHNFRKIKQAIKNAENRTLGHDNKMLQKQFDVAPGLNIFVVGSLCGGTGSGMFLDVGYTLRQIYGEKQNNIIAYFVISPELYSDTPGINASTYAALKELNHYSSESSKFEFMYDPQYQNSVSETRPPFDYIYLVSNETSKGHKILTKEKVCNIIAQKIYLDFADELSAELSGKRVDYDRHLSMKDEHPRRNVQRFLTFGLAKIYFPKERIISICLIDIKMRIINFWLNGEGQSPDAIELLNRFLLNWVSAKADKSFIRFKLEEATIENNKKFNTALNSWRDGLEEEINTSSKRKEDRERIIEKLLGEFRNQFRRVQPGDNDSNRGSWLTKIQENRSRVTEKFKQDIQVFLSELLNPAKPEFSVTTARSWLEAILTYLNTEQGKLEEELQRLGSLHDPEAIEKDWKNAKLVFEDIESKKVFWGKDPKPAEFKEEARKAVQTVCKKVKENFDYTLTQEAIKIVKDLQKLVQKLALQASNFSNLLKNLYFEYGKKSKEIKELNDDEMNGEAVFTDEDTHEYYRVLMPENERRAQFNSLSIKTSERINLNSQFVDFILRDSLIEENSLQTVINETVDEEFGTRGFNISKSVIKQFLQKHSLTNAKTRLRQIIAEAEPLLPLNIADPFFDNDSAKRKEFLAFKHTDEPEIRRFKEILTEEIGVNRNAIKPIQTDEEIIIVNEYGAFPLRIISNIDRIREQYKREKNHPSVHLHTDNRDFIDIIPPDDRKMQKVQDQFYTCVALKKLKEYPKGQGYFYPYTNAIGQEYTINFSPIWSEALDQIVNSKGATETLERLEKEVIENLEKQPQLLDNYKKNLGEYLRLLESLPTHHPNHSERPVLLGDPDSQSNRDGLLMRIFNRFKYIADNSPKNIPSLESHNKNQNQSQQATTAAEEPQDAEIVDNNNSNQTTNNPN